MMGDDNVNPIQMMGDDNVNPIQMMGDDNVNPIQMMGDDNVEDIYWYICKLCNQAFTAVVKLRAHNRWIHAPSSSTGRGLVNVWILSQAVDLQPEVKVKKVSGAAISCGKSKGGANMACSTFGLDGREPAVEQLEYVEVSDGSTDPDSSDKQWAMSDSDESVSGSALSEEEEGNLDGLKVEVKEEQVPVKFRRVGGTRGSKAARFGCTSCDKHYGDRREWRRHVKNVHNPTQELREGRTCPICHKEFSRRREMLNHLQSVNVHKPKRPKPKRKRKRMAEECRARLCPTCGFQAKSISGMTQHQKRMHGPTERERERGSPFECDVCGKPFLRSDALKRHKFTHRAPGSGTLICEECGERFYTTERLSKHRKRAHATSKGYKCEVCDKYYINREALQQHSSVHLDPSHICTQCPKTFKTRSRLQMHGRAIHSGKAHICRVCGRGFRNKQSVLYHEVQVHNFEREGIEGKLFECVQCKKVFPSHHNLKLHEASHTNERKHLCQTCGQRFKLKNQLDHHLKVSHRPNEELPHPCEVCGKRFGWVSHVATHKRIVHSARVAEREVVKD